MRTLTFNKPLETREPGSTRFIILHHSEVSSPHSAADVHHWHQNKGWAGIGYHYFITKKGEVQDGRPPHAVGAHTRGHNFDSIGVCFEGDFNKETLSHEQEQTAVTLLTELCTAYPDAKLRRHSDFSRLKHCPGKNFPFDLIKDLVCNKLIV